MPRSKAEIGKYYLCDAQFFGFETKAVDRVDDIDDCGRITMTRLWNDGNYSHFLTKSADFLKNTWNQDFSSLATTEEVDEFRNRAAESRMKF